MNFFKSVFADDPDPPSPKSDPEPSSPNSQSPETLIADDNPPTPITPKSPSFGWNFGGLIKTISTKSETVLETYKRDLQEFTSGLKSETQVLKHVATSSLDVGAARAQVSLESVGQAIDSLGSVVWKSTADIISQGKESLLAADLDSSDYSDNSQSNSVSLNSNAKYSRFDAQLRAIQCDVNTFVGEPEDGNEFEKWKSGFDLGEFEEEVEGLMRENGSVQEIYKKVVPSVVDHEVFWCRYFYRVHRLKQAEFVRAKLVKRAISTEDEDEELSWDVDDDVEDEANKLASNASNLSVKEETPKTEEGDGEDDSSKVGSSEKKSEVSPDVEDEKKDDTVEKGNEKATNEIARVVEKAEVKEEEEEELTKRADEKEGKAEHSESGKDSDLSVVSSQPSHDEEDLGWDEIEDIGSGDEKKVSQLGSPNRAELRKRLSAAEDDEDLSWDIEDDDEPIKS